MVFVTKQTKNKTKQKNLLTTACDVLARFWRLSGRDVYFVTGTDEHGQKVEQSAKEKGYENPQDFVNEMSNYFVELLQILQITNNGFVRTTDEIHVTAVQYFWNLLQNNGWIYLDTYSGWYSVRDECFFLESELINGMAPTGATVQWVAKEESYFFRLSAFQDQLLQYYQDHPNFIAPESRRKEVWNFVQGGLRDLSISRTSFQWGIPVPTTTPKDKKKDAGTITTADDDDDNHDKDGGNNTPRHVMYVWMDALTNYLSALGYPNSHNDNNDNDNKNNKFETFWPASLHVVGKDILRFHAVYWPALLMAANLPVPHRLFAHGWWTKEGQKISKSIGNVIDPIELVNKVNRNIYISLYIYMCIHILYIYMCDCVCFVFCCCCRPPFFWFVAVKTT